MNEAVTRLAREMADALAAALADDARIVACFARARVEGYDLQVTIEAILGFSSHAGEPPQTMRRVVRRAVELTAHDRRFLRSLRIAADETTEAVE